MYYRSAPIDSIHVFVLLSSVSYKSVQHPQLHRVVEVRILLFKIFKTFSQLSPRVRHGFSSPLAVFSAHFFFFPALFVYSDFISLISLSTTELKMPLLPGSLDGVSGLIFNVSCKANSKINFFSPGTGKSSFHSSPQSHSSFPAPSQAITVKRQPRCHRLCTIQYPILQNPCNATKAFLRTCLVPRTSRHFFQAPPLPPFGTFSRSRRFCKISIRTYVPS